LALQLLLFRHAKSAWDDPNLEDFERPLNQRGRSAALLMGRLLEERGLIPDVVLCSAAKRARESLGLARAEWSPSPEVKEVAEIYRLMPSDYFDLIQQNGAGASRLMVVGHNPAMERTAQLLAGSGDEDTRNLLAEGFPTAAVAVLGFDAATNWAEIEAGQGRLTAFFRPRDVDD
jgi:phosphohistidine phosphatase